VGYSLEVTGCEEGVGAECLIEVEGDLIPAEVVGFSDGVSFLMPLADVTGIRPGAAVLPRRTRTCPVMDGLLGRVVDGLGRPLDGRPLAQTTLMSAERPGRFNPLQRVPLVNALDVGVRAINGLLTVGVGQRIGVFAGSGVGKSMLLGMMSRYTAADVVVVGLIGERGREVREFIDDSLGAAGSRRAVVVASPADDVPVLRLRAARLATEIAHRYRAAGKHVLLVMDSLTRVAQAQREIGLAVGEPPTTKGYPPSVFALLPRLVEQAGNVGAGGSVTAFYTVLAEGDDHQDPIVDAARAILDGHIVLSRQLADAGHYPAIDVEASISRVMPKLVDAQQLREATAFKELWARYAHQQDLIAVGAYVAGSDPLTDRAIKLRGEMKKYLVQAVTERADLKDSRARLAALLGP
jgi:flagellum-specific ATP synthase